jgi:hypothetical protein
MAALTNSSAAIVTSIMKLPWFSGTLAQSMFLPSQAKRCHRNSAKTLVYTTNRRRFLDLRRTLHGEFAPHRSDSRHFKGEFLLLGDDLSEGKGEKGASGLINRHDETQKYTLHRYVFARSERFMLRKQNPPPSESAAG